ncbi:MAG TPA: type II toxin-antitoxin system PemK/MazF family toxin [bacterium]|nr:type II toxin-antitoxin system PemK/MazF family toxin [bacterium]
MKRGDVYDARLDPTEGTEQAGRRPVVIVSRDAITMHMPIVIVVPVTTYRMDRRLYPSQVLLRAPEGGLTADSVALAEQVRALAKGRLHRHRGTLSPQALRQIDHALSIALDLQN